MKMVNKNLRAFYERSMRFVRDKIKNSVKPDTLIVQVINNIMDIEQVTNTLTNDLREWYEIYNPEFSRDCKDNIKFIEMIRKYRKEELLKRIAIKKEESIGADLQERDIRAILSLAELLIEIYKYKETQATYLETLMREFCPNLLRVAGHDIGARLIRHSGSLRKLMKMHSAKIQLLGAEKALFRHMKTGAKPPKFGIISRHPIIQQVKKEKQGKSARALADKISIAVKVDYFNGDFIGDKLYDELRRKFLV